MKKYWISICLLIFCIFSIYRQERCYAAENQGQSAEVVLLIDTSKSMNSQLDRLLNWSNGFCLNCIDRNIVLSYVTFNNKKNEKTVIKPTKINKGTYKSYKDKIKKEIYKNKLNGDDIEGKYTDQLGAFKKAEEILGKSSADIKYIIMLSDGELDYDNKDTPSSEEDDAVDVLKDSCMEFINTNQKIILVGFGKHIKLFQSITDMEKKEKGTSFTKYIDSEYDPADVVNEFLSGIGNSKEVIGKSKDEGESIGDIPFKLEEEYDRVNILIENKSGGKVDFDKDISVCYSNGKKEKPLKGENLLFEPDGNRLNIILTSPKEGEYRILLPKRTWCYKIWHWYTKVEKAELSLFNNNNEVSKTKDKNGITCYETDIFQNSLKLKVELHKDDKVKNDEVQVERVSYLNTNKAGSNTMKEAWGDKGKIKEMSQGPNDEWIYKLKLPLSESNNIYQARVFPDDGPYINTNKIKIISKKIDLKKIPVIDKIIGDKIKLEELIQENYEDYINYIDEMEFITRKDEASGDIKDGKEYNLDEENKEVVFEETGEYIIELKKAGGKTFAMVKINAKNDELYKIKKIVCENIRIVIIVVFIVIIVVLIVIKLMAG